MKNVVLKLFVFCLMVATLTFAQISYADVEQYNIDGIEELEPLEFFSDEIFQEKTLKVQKKPYGDSDLHFTVRVPKEWVDNRSKGKVENDGGEVSRKVLTELIRHTSLPHPEYPRSFFTVDAMALGYEISVQNWFVNYALINGLSLERLTIKHRKELEALYVEVRKEVTYVVRAKVFINGDKIIIVRYYVSSWLHDGEKVMQAQVVNSFELLNMRDMPIEEPETHGFLNQSYFDYPPSWTLKAKPVKSIRHMQASLQKNIVQGKLDGKIDIDAYNKLSISSRSEVIKKFREEFSIPGYEIGRLIEKPEFQKHRDMSFGMMQSYQLLSGKSNMLNYELWVSVLESENYIYLVTLMTAARDEQFYIWAKNVENYKQIVASVRRHNKEGDVYEFLK